MSAPSPADLLVGSMAPGTGAWVWSGLGLLIGAAVAVLVIRLQRR